jgi:hypothetical protein
MQQPASHSKTETETRIEDKREIEIGRDREEIQIEGKKNKTL